MAEGGGGLPHGEQMPGAKAGGGAGGGFGRALGGGDPAAADGAPGPVAGVVAADALLGVEVLQPPTPGPLVAEPLVHGITQTLFNLLTSVQEVCSAVGSVDNPNS